VAEGIPAEYRVRSLYYFFKKFDRTTEKYHREKIKTIGDAYIGAGGHLTENTAHAKNAFLAVLEILEFEKNTKENPPKGIYLFDVRIGISTGPVVAGVVGTMKFQYHIWAIHLIQWLICKAIRNQKKLILQKTPINI
jgi:adenylate cyclase